METNRLDIVPGKIAPVIHTSQYDVGRVFRFYLYDGTSPFTLIGSETVTCSIRKTDGNIVILSVENTASNYVDIVTTEQATACAGQNICELRIEDGEINIGTMDFILQVESDPTEGGIASETEIANLRTQVSEMVGEEVESQYDAESVVFDNAPTAGHGIGFAVTSEGIKTAIKEATTPEGEVSGEIVTFDDALNGVPFIEVEAQIEATQSGSGTPSPDNPRPITGFDTVIVTVKDSDDVTQSTHTVSLGQTVGNGVLNVTTGELTITHKIIDLGSLTWSTTGAKDGGFRFISNVIDAKSAATDTSIPDIICEIYEAVTPTATYNYVVGVSVNRATQQLLAYDEYATAAEFKAAVTGHKVLYELATPITVQLTPEEVKAISGSNTVSANSGDIRVVYRKDFGIFADAVPYDNRTSGLTADNVQDAIDEVKSNTYTKTEADALLADKADTADLATVATSGSYNDLSGKPTVPTCEVSAPTSLMTVGSTWQLPTGFLNHKLITITARRYGYACGATISNNAITGGTATEGIYVPRSDSSGWLFTITASGLLTYKQSIGGSADPTVEVWGIF